jgi:hypothetical protein
MKERYPDEKDWSSVRFSDEVHFGYGPQGKIHIIRKPGQRYCQDCIQETDEVKEKDLKRLHGWAAVGHDFKSAMHLYDVPGNKNGKMSHKVYLKSILKPIVKPWLDRGDDFVLEEDGDSGHGTSKNNIVRSWKEENNLKCYFNCASSPDLSPIENCWLPPKNFIRKLPHWDEATTKGLIFEGWDTVSRDFINRKV